MKRDLAEKITTDYIKPIYGLALKRCANLQDAEDLTQEIVLRVFNALLSNDHLDRPDKFIWTVAHNALANYYRDKSKLSIGIPFDELNDPIQSEGDTVEDLIKKESLSHLHSEIAYLSKLQRRIVIAYYFENKKQDEVSKELGIPVGTVKWHLFEAKKELKKGMDTMRNLSELRFNPIKFDYCGTSGYPGTKGANSNFFRSSLSQNIVYAVWRDYKSINEIADCLGVSPVYVESEAEYLEEYGFLTENKGKYRCNVLLEVPTNEQVSLHDEMYRQSAKMFANDLFDELTSSGILQDERIICGQTDDSISLNGSPRADDNFLLWSLIPYIAALSGEKLMDKSVSFEETATIRPDGGQNICQATVLSPDVTKPIYFDSLKKWNGPCWNGMDYILWHIDSEWSDKRSDESYFEKTRRSLGLYSREKKEKNGMLSKDEYTFLAEMGMIKTNGDYEGMFKAVWQIVQLEDSKIKNELLAIGDHIKEKHWSEMKTLKDKYVKAVLDATPSHLKKMQEFVLQYIYFSDGMFILSCLKELVDNGKLKLPTKEQKKSMTMMILPSD